MTDAIERRVLEGLTLERAEGKKMPTIRGYAAVFGALSVDLGGFRERIEPGAFAESIRDDDIRALVDHDTGKLLGRKSAGTLQLSEDSKGLPVAITPPNTSAGRDVVESIERGDLTGMSFAFKTIDDSWQTIDGEQVRTLKKVQLREVSVVAFPAYPDTTVACRSLEGHKQAEIRRENEAWLATCRLAVTAHKQGATSEADPGRSPGSPKA